MHFHTNSTQISAFYLFAVWWHLCIMCTKLCRQSTSVCCTKGQLKLQYIVTAWFSQYDHYIIINTAITNETCAKFANQWSTVSSSLSCNICSREMRHGVQSLFFSPWQISSSVVLTEQQLGAAARHYSTKLSLSQELTCLNQRHLQ